MKLFERYNNSLSFELNIIIKANPQTKISLPVLLCFQNRKDNLKCKMFNANAVE
jgi:hypothetical protein